MGRAGSILPTGLQQMTPAISQTESVPETPGNANALFLTDQNNNVLRNSNPTASYASNTVPANAYDTPILMSPSNPRPTRGLKSSGTVDLTQEPDDEAVKIKQEPTDADVPEPKIEANATVPFVDDDDEEDLKDELREIQIKRKLRAMEKKKMMAGKMGA
jgi:hypothetical protein